ncbi:MAG: hypothetical protein ABI045_03810 [Flavobacteriales bacterium]
MTIRLPEILNIGLKMTVRYKNLLPREMVLFLMQSSLPFFIGSGNRNESAVYRWKRILAST